MPIGQPPGAALAGETDLIAMIGWGDIVSGPRLSTAASLGASPHFCHGPGDGEILGAHRIVPWVVQPQSTLQQLVQRRQACRQVILQTKLFKSRSLLGRKQNLQVFASPTCWSRHADATCCNERSIFTSRGPRAQGWACRRDRGHGRQAPARPFAPRPVGVMGSRGGPKPQRVRSTRRRRASSWTPRRDYKSVLRRAVCASL